MKAIAKGHTAISGKALDKTLGKLASPLKRMGRAQAGIYLAGGAVRDALRGRPTQDADLVVTQGAVLRAARALARELGGDIVVLGKQAGESPGELVRVLADKKRRTQVDFTVLRAPTLTGDLKARDFTVNALAVKVPWGVREPVLDPTGGVKDIRLKRLRMCSARAFAADPVRLWRAHREALELGLRIEGKTAARIKAEAWRARKCTPERLRDELFKLLKGRHAARALRDSNASGVLGATFPELVAMERVPVRAGPPVRVMEHTLEALDHLERALARPRIAGTRGLAGLASHLEDEPVPGRPRASLLCLAALLHDIGKPHTVSKGSDGHVHFFGHDKLGARLAAILLRKRLRLAESEVGIITRVILHHLRPGYLAVVPRLSDRAAYRFLRDAGEELFELLLLAWADLLATHHERALGKSRQRKAISRIFAVRRAVMARSGMKRLVSGHDIMAEFKIRPGPIVGKLLKAIEEAQALGKVGSKAAALRLAKAELDRAPARC